MTTPGPLIATSPAAIRAFCELVVEVARDRRPALARGLELLDRRPQVEDLLLEGLLLRLEVERGLHERRPLQARVADPRALGGELRRDEEAEARATPRRASPASSGCAGSASPSAVTRCRRRRRATTSPPITTPTTSSEAAHEQRDRDASVAARVRGSRRPGRPWRPAATSGRSDRARRWADRRSSPTAAGPAAPAAGPNCSGGCAPSPSSHPAWNVARSTPSAFVNASSSVSPSA